MLSENSCKFNNIIVKRFIMDCNYLKKIKVDKICVLEERILEPTEIILGGPAGYRIGTDRM
jgi:hypothetical protein